MIIISKLITQKYRKGVFSGRTVACKEKKQRDFKRQR